MHAEGPNPGTCCRCGLPVRHRALIAIIETGSGPGGSAYACLPCARDYAKTSLAPEWIGETIAHAEAMRLAWDEEHENGSRRGGRPPV
ncbi:hypothetical protein [Streptomyces sp. AA1529]|uniref:hypothetical protein n=1 Tax=Streptomyces sp. AA1529 TaxID=1203257 RepID=UPI000362B134|nr:hypothetical protein [Streptomyces sp. AA1529]